MPKCCETLLYITDFFYTCFCDKLWHFFSFVTHFQALIADNFRKLALFQVLIADSFGIFALLHVLFAENFGILALFQALIADNFGIFNTLGKNKHHPGLEA